MSISTIVQRDKKWKLLELYDDIGTSLKQDLYINMPLNNGKLYVTSTLSIEMKSLHYFRIMFGIVFVENLFLALVLSCYYYILAYIMHIETTFLYISYYILNTTSLLFTIEYITFVYSTRSRIHSINRLLKQLLFNTRETNMIFKNISTPTIAYNEIYNIYGREVNKSSSKNPQQSKPKIENILPQNGFIRNIFKGDIL